MSAKPSRVLRSVESPKVWGTTEREAINLHLLVGGHPRWCVSVLVIEKLGVGFGS